MQKRAASKKQKQRKHRVGEGLLSFPKAGNRLSRKESVAFVNLTLQVGKHAGDHRTFGRLREIPFWLISEPEETRGSLAMMLLYTWSVCTEVGSLEQSIKELVEEFTAQGWTSVQSLVSEIRGLNLNKGGRRKGSVNEETKRYEELFSTLKKSAPLKSDNAIVDSIAQDTFPGRAVTPEKLASHRTKVKRTLKRRGLLPKKAKNGFLSGK